MQVFILIYHFSGASKSLPVYMHMRILVASYVFLNGYGHFFYSWMGKDLTFERFLQVSSPSNQTDFYVEIGDTIGFPISKIDNELWEILQTNHPIIFPLYNSRSCSG